MVRGPKSKAQPSTKPVPAEQDTIVFSSTAKGIENYLLPHHKWDSHRRKGLLIREHRRAVVKHAAFLNLATGKVEYSANVTGYEEVDSNRVRLVLDEPKRLPKPIPRGILPGSLQGHRYCNLGKLLSSKTLAEAFGY
jgi:hypothetical protein